MPLVVDIPLPPDTGGNGGAPTGQVANVTAGFSIGSSGPALFIFATEDGTIEAWNTKVPEPDGTPSPNIGFPDDAVVVVNNTAGTPGGGTAGAVFKGLALGMRTISSTVQPFLYATNFRSGNIDVFDSTFTQVTVPGSFSDPKVQHETCGRFLALKAGFAPRQRTPIRAKCGVDSGLKIPHH